MFICIYQFNWYSLSHPKDTSHPRLFVKGEIKPRQAFNNGGRSDQWITAGSSMILSLKERDEVNIMGMNIRQIFEVIWRRLVAYWEINHSHYQSLWIKKEKKTYWNIWYQCTQWKPLNLEYSKSILSFVEQNG